MVRWLIFGVVIAAVVVIFTLVDCALTPRTRIRALPKALWLIVIVILPIVGSLLWYSVGRISARTRGRSIAPDDDPDFLRSLRDDSPPGGDKPAGPNEPRV